MNRDPHRRPRGGLTEALIGLMTTGFGALFLGGCSGGGGTGGSAPPPSVSAGLKVTSGTPPSGAVGAWYDARMGPLCMYGTPNCVCVHGGTRPSCHLAEHGFQLTASGGTAPYSWKWSAVGGSTLPPGLAVSTAGLIDGVPTKLGTYQVIVAVSDSSMRDTANYTITVAPPPPPQIFMVNSLSAVVNRPYSFSFTASGGQLPLTWSETGALPTGLSLSSAGLLAGTPLVTGTFPITVTVQDSAGQNAAPQNLDVTVTLHGFTMTGSMNSARILHTAAVLSDGTVLIVGGQNKTGTPVAASELYDPASRTFSVSGVLGTARYFHTATLLAMGQVLVAGGQDLGGNAIASAELYNAASKTFAAVGSMASARESHTATVLGDGKVLLVGGGGTNGIQATAELFDPSTGHFSATGSMNTPRAAHTATLLVNGQVLVTGGTNGSVALATAELYNPGSGMFTPTGSMTDSRSAHTAALLANGTVLITGGWDAASNVASAEMYDPSHGSFTVTGNMSTPRSGHRAVLLSGGTVLVVGGVDQDGSPPVSAELYDPSTGQFTSTGSLQSPRYGHTATVLASGNVLITGGANASETLATAEVYQ